MYHLRVFLIQFSICCIIFYRVVESSNLKQRQKTEATEINMRDLWLLLHTHIHITDVTYTFDVTRKSYNCY